MSSPADNYWPEVCAHCGGDGKLSPGLRRLIQDHGLTVEQLGIAAAPACDVCGGKAFVLVLQPAQACRGCAGTGRRLQTRCSYCKGAGWMFVLNEAKSS